MRNTVAAPKTDEEIASFEKEEVEIIEELVTILETDKEMFLAHRYVPKKKLLKEAVKVD